MTLVYLAIAFTFGLAAGQFLRSSDLLGCAPPAWLFPSIAGFFAVSFLLFRSARAVRVATLCGFFLVLGIWRYTSDPFERCWTRDDLAFYQSDEGVLAVVEGEIVSFPDVQDTSVRYQLEVTEAITEGITHSVRGRVMVEAARHPVYKYGDTLRVTGLLRSPPVSDDFDYRRFLASRGIHSLLRRPTIERLASGGGQVFWRCLYALRASGAAVINRILPEPAAALTNGMVLGIEGGISDAVNDAFKATGTSHLIVISGSNIAFLAGALIAALGRILPRRRAALIAAPVVLLYVLLVGADPPALRAGIMGLLGLGAVFFGRRGTAYVSLCGAGWVMLALNPLTLWDLGFQLSFMTSLGLILFSRPLSAAPLAWLSRHMRSERAKRLSDLVDSTLIVTVGAQVAVLPLLLNSFGRLSPVSLLTNCLVLPVQPPILAGGIAALIGGSIWQPIGQAVGSVPLVLLTYTVRVVEATSRIPFASVDVGRVGSLFVIGYYLLLGGAFALPRLARLFAAHADLRRATTWGGLFVVPLCLAFFFWRGQPDGKLHLFLIPGPDGEAALMVTPDGRTLWLWDGAGDGEELARATQRGGWLRGTPDLVLTACDENPWPSGQCLDPASSAFGSGLALSNNLQLRRITSGALPALLLTHGQFTTVLPATLSPAAQASIVLPAPAVLLKLAGPNTGTWPTVAYLSQAHPQAILWPLETTYPPDVAAYLAAGTSTARVDPQAVVEVISDGQSYSLVRRNLSGPR